MVVMLLSMLEGAQTTIYIFNEICYAGNVLNGTIGKQMVDTLVESTSNVEVTLNPFYQLH